MAEPTDIQVAVTALALKQADYDLMWSYYDGDQPIKYSTQKLTEIFGNIKAKFTQNWCAVVVDATHDRINLNGFAISSSETNQTKLNDLWLQTEMQLDSDDTHKAALVCGEAFVIGWEEESKIEAYYHDPRMCHIVYDPAHPREKKFAAKWWSEGKTWKVTLYYPERLEYWEAPKKDEDLIDMEGFWKRFGRVKSADNPFGIVPVFHFRRERRKILSELRNVIEPQDAINKLLSDMMVASEFGAFKQRYIIGNVDGTGNLKNGPNINWVLPGGDGQGQDTTVGEFSGEELTKFFEAADHWAQGIAITTRTPKHYLLQQGGDPSGEALMTMEAPLNKKAASYIERFTPVWQEFAAFLLSLDKITVDPKEIEPMFDKPETVQPMTQAQIRQTNVSAGMPLKTLLRDDGWTEKDMDQMQKDQAEEDAREQEKTEMRGKVAMQAFNRGGQ